MKIEKTIASKERILETAVTLFARKGYAGTGMRELADTAGVNLAMINYFFGSKKELLKVILETFFSGYLKIIEAELMGTEPLEERIERFIRKAIVYIEKHQNYMLVTLTELPKDDPEITEYKAVWGKKAMHIINEAISIPLQEKSGVSIPPVAIGPLLVWMMSSRFLFAPILENVNPEGYGENYIKQYPDIIATIFLNGINGLAEKLKEDGHGSNK